MQPHHGEAIDDGNHSPVYADDLSAYLGQRAEPPGQDDGSLTMPDALSTDPCEVELPVDGGIRFVLPRRAFGPHRWLAWLPIVFGASAFAFSAYWARGMASGLFGDSELGILAAVLVGLPGYAVGLSLLGLGFSGLYGHAELWLRDGRLICTERLGPLRWNRTIPGETIRQLAVAAQGEAAPSANDAHTVSLLSDWALLSASLTKGKDRCLAFGYPRPLLLSVANRLSEHLRTEVVTDAGEPLAPVEVVNIPVVPRGETERLEQPADSEVEYQPIPGGFTLNIPARGVWRGSAGLFAFSLLWCGFMTLLTPIFAFSKFGGGPPPPGQELWWLIGFLSLFWLAGIGMLIAAVNMGVRRAALAVKDGELLTIQTSLFGTTRRNWLLNELTTVRVGPSGLEVNDRPVLQLQVVPFDGKPFGLLTGRNAPELEWMATLLRHAIRGEMADAASDVTR